MGEKAKPDFSGYATKAGLVCTDGRTITPDAFKHQDGQRVPLVWQHRHDDPEKVLGHAILYHRPDGMYTEGFFNDSPKGRQAKALVQHKDVEALSIWANQLIEKGKSVLHGMIKEISLCLGGANPGAVIDNIRVAHSYDDDFDEIADEAIIYTGLPLIHSDQAEGSVESSESTEDSKDVGRSESTEDSEDVEDVEDSKDSESTEDSEDDEDSKDSESTKNSEDDETTVQHAYNAMNDVEKKVVHFMVGAAVERTKSELEVSHSNQNQEGTDTGMESKHNVFEKDAKGGGQDDESKTLSHSDLAGIVENAKKNRTTLKDAFDSYGFAHGITDIDVLFPQARNITETPEFLSRRVEWVQGVLDGVKHSPFSRIRSLVADLTFEEARAKGYVKGNLKKEEWISVSKRITTPATIYKKQKLDRDDIVDITDFDVVVWLKAEMRLMFDEELARAILIGDGRDIDDDDKVKDPAGASEGAGIRSIFNDHDLYAPTVMVDDSATGVEIVDAITEGMALYKGSGGPKFYSTLPFITQLLLTRDQFNHRLWKNRDELATELGVSGIVEVEVMESEPDLVGIVVNLGDYTVGADKGGEVSFFDFFDIDYNQYKYLYESRLSGALTKIRSAINFKRAAEGSTLLTPDSPTFDDETSAVTVPTQTHVKFYDETAPTTDISGDTVTLDEGEVVRIIAVADSGYYFADNAHDEWTFQGVATS